MKYFYYFILLVFSSTIYSNGNNSHASIQHGTGGDLLVILPILFPFYELSIIPPDTPVAIRAKVSYIVAAGTILAELALKNVINGKYEIYFGAGGLFIWSMAAVVGKVGIEFPITTNKLYLSLGVLFGKATESETNNTLNKNLTIPTISIGQSF